MSDMQNLRIAITVAQSFPAMMTLTDADAPTALSVAPEVVAATNAQKSVTHGLNAFLLKPPGVSGKDLLDHMTNFRRRDTTASDTEKLEPSAYLDVVMTADQQMLMNPKPHDLTVRAILRDAGGVGASLKLAKRKLDATGFVKAHCGRINGPVRMKRVSDALHLADSIAEISRANASDRNEAKKTHEASLWPLALTAVRKLRKLHAGLSEGSEDEKTAEAIKKLTKADCSAILARYFQVHIAAPTTKKDVLTERLTEENTKAPHVIKDIVLEAEEEEESE